MAACRAWVTFAASPAEVTNNIPAHTKTITAMDPIILVNTVLTWLIRLMTLLTQPAALAVGHNGLTRVMLAASATPAYPKKVAAVAQKVICLAFIIFL